MLCFACVPGRGGWDLSVLPPSASGGNGLDPGRIHDGLPQIEPSPDGLSLFLCRWPTGQPIPVRLSPNARAREQRLWQKALRAWESAGLGISFVAQEERRARGIELDFPTGRRRPRGTGDALADCQVGGFSQAEGPEEARLVWASIHLNRSLPSWKGLETPLDEDELFGAMLHELGHALGFSGHARSGRSIMVADKAQVREIARQVSAGAVLPAPELTALYRLPSGYRVGTLPVPAPESRRLQDLQARAEEANWRGPFSRVGDRQAEFFYRGDRGQRMGVRIENYLAALGRKASPIMKTLP